jgi:hypothetical protein
MDNFYTNVISRDQRFSLAARVSDLSLLEPVTRERVQAVLVDARARGMEYLVYETFRSRARQLALFARGASKLREVGVHHFGLACDVVKDVGGDPSWKGSFVLLGELAAKHGLVWGGNWGDPSAQHGFVDPVHVQRIAVAKQRALFRGDFYPDTDYDPYRRAGG